MTFNAEMEHGGFMVGRLVHLTLNLKVDLVGENTEAVLNLSSPRLCLQADPLWPKVAVRNSSG